MATSRFSLTISGRRSAPGRSEEIAGALRAAALVALARIRPAGLALVGGETAYRVLDGLGHPPRQQGAQDHHQDGSDAEPEEGVAADEARRAQREADRLGDEHRPAQAAHRRRGYHRRRERRGDREDRWHLLLERIRGYLL